MSTIGFAIAIILAIGCFPAAQCLDYEYRALLQVGGQVNGNVTTRQTDISATVQALVGEAAFTFNTVTAVLETLTATVSSSNLVVNFAFTNASVSASQLTTLLEGIGIFNSTIDGFGVNATDHNECLTNNGGCSATCSNTAGSFVCSCAAEYIANGTLCDLPYSFFCDAGGITLTAVKSFFSNLNIGASSLRLGTCQGTDNGTSYDYSGQCGANSTTNGSYITLSWSLTNVNASAKILTGTAVTYQLSCTIQSSYNVTAVGFNISADNDVVVPESVLVSISETASIDVGVFENAADPTSAVTGTVATGSPLNFKFGPTSSFSPDVVTVIRTASAFAPENPSLTIELVKDGCIAPKTGINDEVIDKITLANNGQGSQVTMSISAFFFSDYPRLTMTFSVKLCLTGTSCIPSCSKRKRSVLSMRERRDIGDTEEISIQFVRDPNDYLCKDKECGSGACIVDAKLNEFCLCPESTYVGSNGKCIDPAGNDMNTSVEENNEGTNGFNNMWLFVLIGLGFFAVLLAVVLAVILMRKRYSSSNEKQLVM